MRRQDVQELIARALVEDKDSEVRWDCVRALWSVDGVEVLVAARRLCESDDPSQRVLGVDILAQLGAADQDGPKRPFRDEALAILKHLCFTDTDDEVLQAAASALGMQYDPSAVAPLLRLKDHPDAGVRRSVASALGTAMRSHEDEQGIKALVRLMEDEDDDVRDWASFELGVQLHFDCAEVRDALARRLDDPYGPVVGRQSWA